MNTKELKELLSTFTITIGLFSWFEQIASVNIVYNVGEEDYNYIRDHRHSINKPNSG